MALCPTDCGRASVGPWREGDCRLCWLALNDSRYAKIHHPKPIRSRRKSLPIIRPDRCDHFTGRTEFRPGCSGWKCKGGCKLGHPAKPGVFCQSCPSYEIDPDYAGKGTSGWLA